MKHSEREHLKENELAKALAAANQSLGQNRTQVLAITAAVVAVLVAIIGYTVWSRNADSAVSGLLAASILMTLGRFDEARAQYEQLTAGSDLVARGAALGKAQAQVRAGQLDPAIESLKALSTQTTTDLPVDGVLMELAKAYRAAGKTEDARKTLNEIVEKHAQSPFVGEARAELDKLKS
jgi:FimV-like protein